MFSVRYGLYGQLDILEPLRIDLWKSALFLLKVQSKYLVCIKFKINSESCKQESRIIFLKGIVKRKLR
jgi:hypothetical protein